MALNRFLFSCRFCIFVLCSAGSGIIGTNFSALHFSWTCMVNTTAAAIKGNNYDINSYFSSSLPVNSYGGDLAWGKDVQEILFSAYSIGAVLLFIPASSLVTKFGAKIVFLTTIVIVAIATMLIPAATQYTENEWVVFGIRIVVGLGGAVVWPMIYDTASHWVPKTERGFAIALLTTGFPIGQGFSILLSGLECTYLGWPSIFYASGVATLLYAGLWFLLYSNEPETSRFISEKEKNYILGNRARTKTEKLVKVPWKAIATSVPVWATCLANLCIIYVDLIVMQFMPTYLKENYLLDATQNGLFSSFPLVLQLVARWIAGWSSELPFSTASGRIKVMSAISLFGGSFFMVLLAVDTLFIHSAILSIILFSFLLFFSSFKTGGFIKSPLYLAPAFSSIVGSLVSASGYIGMMTIPYIVASLTYTNSHAAWSHVFIFSAASAAFGGVCFTVFGSGELQPWANHQPQQQNGSLENSKCSTVTLISIASSKSCEDLSRKT